jgi:uncharacterized DUF497 family protein
VDFEWDEAKDLTNRQDHGLGFAEAAELFESGVEYLEIFDVDHSESEDRFIAIGPIAWADRSWAHCRHLHRARGRHGPNHQRA